jgi:hypothetical protein
MMEELTTWVMDRGHGAGSDNGGNDVGGVVETVGVVEDDHDHDRRNGEDQQGVHGLRSQG